MAVNLGMHFMKEVDIMKNWTSPTIEELDLKDTACNFFWWLTDELSGEGETPQPPVITQAPTPTPELGTCSSAHWAGNGLTIEEAQANNPYWSGYWGQ